MPNGTAQNSCFSPHFCPTFPLPVGHTIVDYQVVADLGLIRTPFKWTFEGSTLKQEREVKHFPRATETSCDTNSTDLDNRAGIYWPRISPVSKIHSKISLTWGKLLLSWVLKWTSARCLWKSKFLKKTGKSSHSRHSGTSFSGGGLTSGNTGTTREAASSERPWRSNQSWAQH